MITLYWLPTLPWTALRLKLCFLGPPPKETSCTQIFATVFAFMGISKQIKQETLG